MSEPHKPWNVEVADALAKAAALCADNGVDLDAWMKGAWTAYMDARPGYREDLEEQALIGQLDEIRKAGRMAAA